MTQTSRRALALASARSVEASVVERALSPLDALRAVTLRGVIRLPGARGLLFDRDTRAPVLLSLQVIVAFGLTLLFPTLSLVLAPVVLGVPHVAADLRYLVVRRRLPGWWRWTVVAFAVALVLLRVVEEARLGWGDTIRAEHAAAGSWVLLGALAGARSAGWSRRGAIAVAVAAALMLAGQLWPGELRLGFVHAHNAVAVVLWCALFRRGAAWTWAPVVLVALGAALLASGALLELTLHHGVLELFGLHLFVAADWLAPGVSGAAGVSIALSYAFLQSVHYAVGLVAIPASDGGSRGGSSFRAAWRGLARDLGGVGRALSLALSVLVLAAAAFSLLETRRMYLSLATFHGWLELATLAYLWPRSPGPDA